MAAGGLDGAVILMGAGKLGLFRKLALTALALNLCGVAPSLAGDAEKGRAFATEHCSRCHVIPDHNRMGGIESTPSFSLLLKLDDWRDRFGSFYARRPHPVFVRMAGTAPPSTDPSAVAVFEMTQTQLDDLMAFVEDLRAAQ